MITYYGTQQIMRGGRKVAPRLHTLFDASNPCFPSATELKKRAESFAETFNASSKLSKIVIVNLPYESFIKSTNDHPRTDNR